MQAWIDLDRIVEDYRAGATFEQLGKKWGRDPSGIRRAMLRAGVELEDGRARTARGVARRAARDRARRAERRALVEQMHAAGDSVEDIAQAAGYTEKTVREIVGANKWRDQYGERNVRVVEIYRAGHTIAETARITGVQPTQVGRIVKRAGVSRPRGPAPRSLRRPVDELMTDDPQDRPTFNRNAPVYTAAPAAATVCCRCDEPIAAGDPAVAVPGVNRRGLAHPDCTTLQ